MENNEVMETMENEVVAENEAVYDTEPETIETANTEEADEAPAKADYMKDFGKALACGVFGALGAAVANKIVIPACEKAIHKACDGIKGMWNKHKEKKAAKTNEPPVDTAEKEPEKKTGKK